MSSNGRATLLHTKELLTYFRRRLELHLKRIRKPIYWRQQLFICLPVIVQIVQRKRSFFINCPQVLGWATLSLISADIWLQITRSAPILWKSAILFFNPIPDRWQITLQLFPWFCWYENKQLPLSIPFIHLNATFCFHVNRTKGTMWFVTCQELGFKKRIPLFDKMDADIIICYLTSADISDTGLQEKLTALSGLAEDWGQLIKKERLRCTILTIAGRQMKSCRQ